MAAIYVTAVLASVLVLCTCDKNFTVTSEVTFDIEVKNWNGQGDDISDKLVIGLFGDTTPVTSLNFKTLCSGWTREDVSATDKQADNFPCSSLFAVTPFFKRGLGGSNLFFCFFFPPPFDLYVLFLVFHSPLHSLHQSLL